MNAQEARGCISRHSDRTVTTSGNCASLRTESYTHENAPAILSNDRLATIICNEATSSSSTLCVNEVAVASGGTEIGLGDMINEARIVTENADEEFNREEFRTCKNITRHKHTHSFDNRDVHINTFLRGESAVKLQDETTSDINPKNNMGTRDSKRSFRIRPNRSRRVAPRRYSLPSYLSNLTVGELTEIDSNATSSCAKNNIHSSDNFNDSCCIELNTTNLFASTPPPSYRSLTRQNLSDIPPSYECVTGLSLNIGVDPLDNVRKCNSRNHGTAPLEPQSKILIVLIVLIVVLVTVILALAEAFAI